MDPEMRVEDHNIMARDEDHKWSALIEDRVEGDVLMMIWPS